MTMVLLMQRDLSHIAAGEFKAKCLQLMDQVKETQVPIIITKHGVAIAKLVPIEKESVSLFGLQPDSVAIQGDIIAPIGENWDADK